MKLIHDRGGDLEQWENGYLDGWQRLGIGSKPLQVQCHALKGQSIERIQFDFNRGYGDSPSDLDFLREFSEVQAVQCDAFYNSSDPLNELSEVKSFRDHVYNRTGIDWEHFYQVQDLGIYDYHGKYHPDYTRFSDLRSVSLAYLPKKYAELSALPLKKARNVFIKKSPLQSLGGMFDLPFLEDLTLVGCAALTPDGRGVGAPNLKRLTLVSCRKFNTLTCVTEMPSLEVLQLEQIGEIESFNPLRSHPTLRRIVGFNKTGARVSKEILASLPKIEFISPGLLGDE